MSSFIIRFLICNISISCIMGILFLIKYILRKTLSPRMQYYIWFLFLGILSIPFIPLHFPTIFDFTHFQLPYTIHIETNLTKNHIPLMDDISHWSQDFTISVNSHTTIGNILFAIWVIGMFIMCLRLLKSYFALKTIQKSALPLQNAKVKQLYRHCLQEMGIQKQIPIYSTAFLKSPIFVGFLKPSIYIPIYLISDYNENDLRFILLHELEHKKQNDALINHFMNLFRILYWFHPLIHYALYQMRNDREIACDAAVLEVLSPFDYIAYGNTLIRLAETISSESIPFAFSLIGNKKQLQHRIIQIVNYETISNRKKVTETFAFLLISLFLIGIAPTLSTYASNENYTQWQQKLKNVSYIDLSSYFGKYQGSFVLYDSAQDTWQIYHMQNAIKRIAPDSTYKIYDALFGLEADIITPSNSLLLWNGETYPFAAWNTNQTLESAMQNSVNWYFQTIDTQIGKSALQQYVTQIGYGNQNLSGDLSSYWLESSLKISPIEQVELLIQLQNNDFGFAPENILAVKNAIRLSATSDYALYGKTGTGRIDEKDVNGWFIGYIETKGHTYFFATNVQDKENATGQQATEITMSILSDMKLLS